MQRKKERNPAERDILSRLAHTSPVSTCIKRGGVMIISLKGPKLLRCAYLDKLLYKPIRGFTSVTTRAIGQRTKPGA